MRARRDNRDWRNWPDDRVRAMAGRPGVGPIDFYQIEAGVTFFSGKKIIQVTHACVRMRRTRVHLADFLHLESILFS